MMDVYKKSLLGKIPNEWEVLSTDDIGEITSSKRVHRADYTKNGVPFFRGKEISQLAKGDKLSDIVYIKTETYNELKSKFGAPESGDILITAVGTIGSIYLVKEGDKFYFKDGNLMWIRNISDRLNRRFLMHYLRSSIFQNLIGLASGGSSQKALTIVKFKRLFIPVPNELEQQKIAEILSMVDAKIEVIDQQITETTELKKGLMQRLLTKGIGHTEFKDSPLGKIPKSWEVERSSNVFELIHGYQYRDYDFTEIGLPIVKIGQFNTKGELDMTGCSFFSSDRAEEFANKRIFNGDVLMALTGATLGKSCWVNGLKNPVYQNYRVGKFVPHDENVLSKRFLYFLIGSPLALNQIMSKINSGAQGNVGKSDFEKLKITLPPIEEQHRISSILSSVDEKLYILEEKKTNYEELKQGLMQQLLTGKVRVQLNSTASA